MKKKNQNVVSETIKANVAKNKEALLEILSKNIKEGNKACPRLLGAPCIGEACMFFLKFKGTTAKGEPTEFWNCADVQTPLLILEMLNELRKITKLENLDDK